MNDILLTEDLDLAVGNGDFVTGESAGQQQMLLLLLQKGSIKTKPLTGVGVQDYLNSDEVNEMLREVRHQFQLDGMQVNEISWDELTGNLEYDANYNIQ